jgi:ribonuclease P protein component
MATAVQRSGVVSARPQVWRITDRRTFEELRLGRRARQGQLTVTWLAPPAGAPAAPPRVGFSIGKAAGGAVTRNRVRRRLRAAARELASRGRLPAGAYLLGATAAVATMPWSELVDRLLDAIVEAQR